MSKSQEVLLSHAFNNNVAALLHGFPYDSEVNVYTNLKLYFVFFCRMLSMLCKCMVFLIFAMIDTHAHSVMSEESYGESTSGVAYRV